MLLRERSSDRHVPCRARILCTPFLSLPQFANVLKTAAVEVTEALRQ